MAVVDITKFITRRQAGEMMGVSPDYVRRLTNMGKLVAHYVGTTPLYRRAEIERYIETHPGLGKRAALA